MEQKDCNTDMAELLQFITGPSPFSVLDPLSFPFFLSVPSLQGLQHPTSQNQRSPGTQQCVHTRLTRQQEGAAGEETQ